MVFSLDHACFTTRWLRTLPAHVSSTGAVAHHMRHPLPSDILLPGHIFYACTPRLFVVGSTRQVFTEPTPRLWSWHIFRRRGTSVYLTPRGGHDVPALAPIPRCRQTSLILKPSVKLLAYSSCLTTGCFRVRCFKGTVIQNTEC